MRAVLALCVVVLLAAALAAHLLTATSPATVAPPAPAVAVHASRRDTFVAMPPAPLTQEEFLSPPPADANSADFAAAP